MHNVIFISCKLTIRGIRQGCPLSLIFVLATEVYSCKIRQSKCIKGIPLPNDKEAKLTQYADDLTLFLSDENSITKAFLYAHDIYAIRQGRVQDF